MRRDRPDTSNEQLVEAKDDTPHEVAEFLREWKDRPTLDNPLVLDRYASGDLHVLVRFRIPAQSEDFIALFIASESVRRGWGNGEFPVHDFSVREIRDVVAENVSHFGAGVTDCPNGGDRQDEFVLVGDVELMEDPESVIPSLVWIERPDRLASLFANVLLYTSEATFESLEVPTDREGVFPGDGVITTVLAHEITKENIQGGSQVMRHISKDEGDLFRDLGKILNPTDHFPVRPILNNNGAFGFRLFTKKRSHLSLEVVKMMLGPMEFCPRTPRWVGHF